MSKSEGLIIVQFKTEWNGSCQVIAPMFEELSKTYHHAIRFYTIDADDEKELAKEYMIVELPSILFVVKNEIIDHVAGIVPRAVLTEKIDNALMLIQA